MPKKRCEIVSDQIKDEAMATKEYRSLAKSFRKTNLGVAILVDKIADDEESHKKALTKVFQLVCKK